MKTVFQWFRNFFNKDKDRKVYCQHCGEHVVAEFYRCPACGKWRRNIFNAIIASVFCVYGASVWFLYLWKVLPAIEAYLKESGVQLEYAVKMVVQFTNFITNFSFIVIPIFTVLVAYLVFIWKPHKNWGINLFLILTLAFNIVIHSMLFLGCLQLVIFLPR